MIEAIYTSDTGVIASQGFLDVTSNNLANLNTTAFKENQVRFQDLFYNTLSAAGHSAAVGSPPVATQLGHGVQISSTAKSFTEGPLENTGLPLDLAINGNGFFQLSVPGGGVRYTRDGTFHLDPTGRLVSAQGFLLQPPITVPPGTTQITVGTDGTVTVFTQSAPSTPRVIGQITLVTFANPQGLIAVGNNQFAASPNSGSPVTAVPGTGGTGTIQQGFLEGSNVDVTTELTNLLIAQQTFVFNSEAIQIASQMLLTTAELVSLT
jgi:flagellar basal-body rod protein FlgG